ncbi:MAG TPA: GntR family transcriptional regulator, partial [Rhodobacteraceae bacterium]|nr:GntR family transcriptional regulator [Paracoccaceae bacterium]
MPEKPATTQSARDRHATIHREIRHRICLLDYAPGQRLSEAELAEEFGTSRSPLRRVLARLEDEGLVKSVHGVGTFVTDADIKALEQAYRLRVELVALTGRLDPVPPDMAFMDTLNCLIAQSADILVSGTPRSFTQLDIEVFRLLSTLTSNAPLRQIQARLYYGTKRIWLKTAIAARLDLEAEY